MPAVKVSDSGLTRGEWMAVAGGVLLALSLLALPWFAVTVDGFAQPGSDGAAFELLAGLDVVLLLTALVPLVVPALRAGPLGAQLGDGAAARVVALAGLIAALVTLFVLAEPPEPDVLISGALESSADVGLAPRAGAFIGLVASVAILAGGAITMAAAAAARRGDQEGPKTVEAPQLPAPAAAGPAPPRAAVAASPAARPRPKRTKPAPAKAARKQSAAKKPAGTNAAKKANAAKKPAAPKKAAKPAARKAAARKPRTTKARKAPAKISFAAATEAQLRELGLSTTQARRVLRYRDGGQVSGVAELEVIPGLPKATVFELKSKLRA